MQCLWTSARINGGFRSPAPSSPSCNIPQPGARTTLRPGVHLALVRAESADGHDVFRLGSLLALGDVELDLLPFLQAAVAAGDRAEVHEHVRAALDRDEAVASVAVEPLHGALRHLDLLVVHAAPHDGRGRARHLLCPACHGTRRGREPCGCLNCPAAGTFPAWPASAAGANTPAG